jgi:hypothetical protein
MPRTRIGERLCAVWFRLRTLTGQRVEVGSNPCEDSSYSCLIKLHVLGGVLCIGTQVDDHLLAMFQPLQPVKAPLQHLNLVCEVGLYPGRRGRWFCVLPAVAGLVECPEMAEPRRDLLRLGALEELMDTAAAQPCRGGDLSDGQPGVVGPPAAMDAKFTVSSM